MDIVNLQDSDLAPAILEMVEKKVNDDYEREFEIVTALSPGVRMVYATWFLEAEVANAGFLQYFFNSTGRFASEALEGYRLIGALQHADTVERAIKTFDQEKVTLKTVWEKSGLEESYRLSAMPGLDDIFMGLTEDVDALRNRYIREHLDAFS